MENPKSVLHFPGQVEYNGERGAEGIGDREGESAMRRMEFKMERPGLLETGQKVMVTEGLLPSNYYYIIDPALAMSANIPFRDRLLSREGVVSDIVENARGYYVTVEFDEPERQ